MLIAALFTIAKTWKQPKWNGFKKIVVYIHNGILLSHKKWNYAICSYMDVPRDHHTKWNKSKRERQISDDTTYLWNIKRNTNDLFTK